MCKRGEATIPWDALVEERKTLIKQYLPAFRQEKKDSELTERLGSSPHWRSIPQCVSQLKSPGPERAAAGIEECTVHPNEQQNDGMDRGNAQGRLSANHWLSSLEEVWSGLV